MPENNPNQEACENIPDNLCGTQQRTPLPMLNPKAPTSVKSQ
jgi:hypothetical protein